MLPIPRIQSLQRVCLILTLLLGQISVRAYDITGQYPTSQMPETKAPQADAAENERTFRAYLRLQEQMHAALLAIERNRQETSSAVARSAEHFQERLEAIEKGVMLQRQEQVQAVHNSHQLVLILASLFAGFGFLAVVFASWMQFRTMGKMAELAANLPANQGALVPSRAVGALPYGEGLAVTTASPAEQSSLRLRHLIQSLETRVRELEQTVPLAETPAKQGHKNGGAKLEAGAADASSFSAGGKTDRVTVLLGKGQSLLNLGDASHALDCFNQVLAVDPENAEALIKKGTALERLQRLEEAIDCYDRAIELNNSMTLAYLYKGGVYNQLERFNEALECYEQALKSQQKTEQVGLG